MRNQADSTRALRADSGKGREIVDAAAEMFRTRGYEGTTISDIAASVGLLPSSIYHYARSKEEVLYTVVRLTHEENYALLDDATYSMSSPLGRLREFVVRNLTYVAQYPAYVVTYDLEYRNLSDDHRNEILSLRREYRAFLTRLIEDGQAAGEIIDSISPKLTSIAILSLLNSVARWFTGAGDWTIEELVDVHCHLLLDGIAVPDNRP